MGFKPKAQILRLTFEDPDYEGLMVRIRRPNMGTFLDVSELRNINPATAATEDVDKVNQLFRHFVEAVVEWNLEDDDDQPLPQTVEGLRTLDIEFVMDMVGAWMDGVMGMSPGLPQPSGNGQPSQEASIPMEALSPSLPS